MGTLDWINTALSEQTNPPIEPMSNLEYILRFGTAARQWQESGGYPKSDYWNTLSGLNQLRKVIQNKPPITGELLDVRPMPHSHIVRDFLDLFRGKTVGAYNPSTRIIETRGDYSPKQAFRLAVHEGSHSTTQHPAYEGYHAIRNMVPEETSPLIKEAYRSKPYDWTDETLSYGLEELMARKHFPGHQPIDEFLPVPGKSRDILEEYFKRRGY